MQKMDSALSNRLAKMSFVCSLMVVALHGYCGPDWVHRMTGICDVAVPFFFVCSGFLFAGHMDEKGWYGRQLKRRIRSLLVPYVFWNSLRWLFVAGLGVLASWMGLKYDGVQRMGISAHEWWKIFGFDLIDIPLGVFWFVRCLMVMVIVSPLFNLMRSRSFGMFFLISAYIGAGTFVCFYDVSFYGGWSLHAFYWIRAFIFFAAGVYFRCHMRSVGLPPWTAVILAVLGCVMMAMGDQLLSWIGIPVLMLGLWLLFGGNPWPTSVTGCAFAVYALHSFVGTIAGLIMKMGGLPLDSAFVWLVKVGFMATFSIAIALVMKRIFPRLADIVFGGRG